MKRLKTVKLDSAGGQGSGNCAGIKKASFKLRGFLKKNASIKKRKHAQTFNSFDDFLDQDDGDYKSTGRKDYSTSESDDISGEEDEEERSS